jgi:hypothetical protein
MAAPIKPELLVSWSFEYEANTSYSQAFSALIPLFNSGSWTLTHDSRSKTTTVSCADVASSVSVSSVSLTTQHVTGSDQRQSGGDLANTQFPPSKRWSIINPITWNRGHYSWSANFQVSIKDEVSFPIANDDEQAQTPPVTPPALAAKTVASRTAGKHQNSRTVLTDSSLIGELCSGYLKSCTANNVIFHFPRTKQELWANSSTLGDCSSYFKTLFGSGFKESTAASSDVDSEATSTVQPAHDSDAESDSVSCGLVPIRASSALPSGVKRVVVQSASYTTYHAILVWIHTGYISFAPLSPHPIAPVATSDEPSTKRARLESAAKTDPDLPLPASPKSVYMLAHLLELAVLMSLALKDFKSKLTAENVLYQLTTGVAVHDEVRNAIVAFAQANWSAVKASKAAAELTKPEVLESLDCGMVEMGRVIELLRKC